MLHGVKRPFLSQARLPSLAFEARHLSGAWQAVGWPCVLCNPEAFFCVLDEFQIACPWWARCWGVSVRVSPVAQRQRAETAGARKRANACVIRARAAGRAADGRCGSTTGWGWDRRRGALKRARRNEEVAGMEVGGERRCRSKRGLARWIAAALQPADVARAR